MSRRADYLRLNRTFSSELLQLVIRGTRAGLSRETIEAALAHAAAGDQELAEHVIVLDDLLAGELEKTSTGEAGA